MIHVLVGWEDADAGQRGPAVRAARVIQEADYGRQVQGGLVLVRMKLEAALRELITGDGLSKLRWLLTQDWQPSAAVADASEPNLADRAGPGLDRHGEVGPGSARQAESLASAQNSQSAGGTDPEPRSEGGPG